MNHQSLLAIDSRLARLRDEIAAGKAMFGVMIEVDELIERRQAMLRAEEISRRRYGVIPPESAGRACRRLGI